MQPATTLEHPHEARFPHPAARPSGKPFTICLPIETRPLYRTATALIAERTSTVWFVRPSVFPPQHLDRLESALRQVRRVHHAHLAPTFGLASERDPLIAWPHARQTLAGLIASRRYRRAEAGALVAPIAEALAVAHQERLAHGHLDPAQIAVRQGRLAVMGVGIWTCLDPRLVRARYCGEHAETVAPEVRAGDPLTARSDCFSVAMIFARLLSGDERLSAVAARRLFAHMGLEVMTAALVADPAHRLGSMSTLVLELGRLDRRQLHFPERGESLEGVPPAAVVPSPAPPHGPPEPAAHGEGKTSPLLLLVLALAPILLAALAFYLASTL